MSGANQLVPTLRNGWRISKCGAASISAIFLIKQYKNYS
ncbi:hypothetical protein C7S15_2856 [Burkholderia cepacia]|nr:hypothetical protein [Burkholderia cepacia]